MTKEMEQALEAFKILNAKVDKIVELLKMEIDRTTALEFQVRRLEDKEYLK